MQEGRGRGATTAAPDSRRAKLCLAHLCDGRWLEQRPRSLDEALARALGQEASDRVYRWVVEQRLPASDGTDG